MTTAAEATRAGDAGTTEAWYVARTLQALELLALRPLSAPQLATALGAHPRTARRLRGRLEQEGYVRRSGDGQRRYAPTLRIVALASRALDRAELPRRAIASVERLQRETGLAAHLAVPSYRSVLCVMHAGHETVSAQPLVCELMPAHATAAGKALLAWREEWCASVLDGSLERHTAQTLIDATTLRRELARIRRTGFAAEDGEWEEGVQAVGTPVIVGGEAVAAMAASGTGIDVGPVVASAAELGEALGGADA